MRPSSRPGREPPGPATEPEPPAGDYEDSGTGGVLGRLYQFRTFEALRFRNYRLLWLGQAGNSAGQWMDQVTRGYLMYEITGSPLQLGLVSAARAIPMLMFSVIAGAVADRYGRKNQLVIAQVVNAILNFALGTLVITGQIHPWHVYATAILAGLVQAFQQPARQSMISDVVPRSYLPNAIGLNSIVLNATRSIGPALAGVIIAAVDTGGSYLIQGMMYGVSTLWTIQIHAPETSSQAQRRRDGAPQESMLESTLAGARYIWHDPLIRALMMILLVPSLLGQPYTSLIPVFAKDVLHVGPQGQGLLLTAAGLGALVGAISVATLGNTGRQGLIMLIGALMFGCSIIAFALTPWFGLALVFMTINGLCGVTYGTQATTILQTHTPRELRGRVMGVYMMNRSLVPLGSLMAGAMAQVLGAPTTVVLMGSACAVLALWALISVPRVREAGALPDEGGHRAGPARPVGAVHG